MPNGSLKVVKAKKADGPTERQEQVPRLLSDYIEAHKRFEKTGRVGVLIPFFSEAVEIVCDVSLSPTYGVAGLFRFWRDLKFSYQEIETKYSSVLLGLNEAVLTWQARGILPTGDSIRLEGLTYLSFEQDRVTRICYFSNRLAYQAWSESNQAA